MRAAMPKEPSRYLIKRLLLPYHALIRRFAPDGERAFFEPERFPWTTRLEREWREIRAEAETFLGSASRLPLFTDVEPGQDDIANELWRSVVLRFYNRDVPENCAHCPRTTALLQGIPGVTLAMFSVLEPGMHIRAHHGPFKGVLRYHLGLLVPGSGRCGIRVGDEFRRWEEGASLVFDDTFEHEAWNETSGRRVVLFVDFLRPLRWPLSTLNRLLMELARWTPGVRRVQENARRLAAAAK
jgi:aspartyl/asparaginyl beta-hydroxylase (cupin superfamily)